MKGSGRRDLNKGGEVAAMPSRVRIRLARKHLTLSDSLEA